MIKPEDPPNFTTRSKSVMQHKAGRYQQAQNQSMMGDEVRLQLPIINEKYNNNRNQQSQMVRYGSQMGQSKDMGINSEMS